MKKYLVKILFLVLFSFLLSFNVQALDNNFNTNSYENIDMVLTGEDYSYLPIEAKEYIKDAYNKTGEIVLTERNKKEGKPYLNPKYINYLTLSKEEKQNVGNIPEVLIVDFISSGRLRASFPATYDLRNVNGDNYITPLKNQGSLGICWAMTTAEQAESFLMVQKSTPYNSSSEKFSPRQLDYAASTDGINNYTNENGVRPLTNGGNYQMSYFTLSNGISLIPESVMPFNQSYAKKELYQVLNYGNSKYEVEQSVAMPKLSSGYTTDQFNSYLDQVKSRIISYGGAYIGTGSPQGSCGSKNTDGTYVVVDNTDCNTDTDYGSHAMQIIGWDDNYNWAYCSSGTNHYNVNSNGTCNTGTLKTGTGAWLIRNSWGNDANYSYVYVSYNSINADIAFIVSLSDMSSKNWDNNYHKMPWSSDGSSYVSIVDSASFTKTIAGEEVLKKVKFTSLAQNGSFNISVNNGSQTYSNVATVQTPYPGVYTVDLSSSNIRLSSSSFSVSIVSSSFSNMLMGSISAFTSNVPTQAMIKTNDISVDLTSNINRAFTVYSSTKNIPSNSTVTYKIYKENTDVTNRFNIVNNIVAENNINAYINVIDYVPSGDYTLETKYEGRTYTSTISITSENRTIIVTKPDNTTVTLNYGDTYNLGYNTQTKPTANIATVTFKYQDGITADRIGYVKESYTTNGWLVNGVHKNNNEVLTLTEDITINYDYNTTRIGPEFDTPMKDNYMFEGWFTEENGGDELTSYTRNQNITLYAHWLGDFVEVHKPSGEVELMNYGDTYILGTNNIAKANENISMVTFKYQLDGFSDTYGYVQKSFTPNGWYVNNIEEDNNISLTLTENITIAPRYTETVVPLVFQNPEKTNYIFEGWYTGANSGSKLTSYSDTTDTIVYAHWTYTKPTDFDINSNLVYLLSGETHQIIASFIPSGRTDNLIYSEYDNNIISVSNNGLVTGLSPGETTIKVALESNPNINKTVTVKVIKEEITSSTLDVETKDLARIIIGEEPETSLDSFKNKLDNKEFMNIYTKSNELVNENNQIIKTGMKVKLVVNDQTLDEAIIIIRGDIDEDGYIDVSDRGVMNNNLLEKNGYMITDYRLYAADLDIEEDETLIDVSDKRILLNYLIEKIDSVNPKNNGD